MRNTILIDMDEGARHAASARGVAVRQARAALKDDLRHGRRDHIAVIDDAMDWSEPVATGLKVGEFLRTLPYVGVTKSGRMLADLNISPHRRLGGLGSRQGRALRDHVAAWLHDHPIIDAEGMADDA